MARLARLSLGGYPHLVAQHASARAVIADDEEARQLLRLLHSVLADTGVALHGYALLPQGIWLLATPSDEQGLGRAVQSIGRSYVRWVNARRAEEGGLFDGRYRAALLEPEVEFLRALRYVEWQPVRRELVAVPEDYRWSSCRQHLGLASDADVANHPLYWSLGNTPFERQAAWRSHLQQGLSAAESTHLERALTGGWVLGSERFVRQLAPLCVRRPAPARAGRPRAVEARTPSRNT